MHRCAQWLAPASVVLSLCLSTSAFAQAPRNFPATALRGEMVVTQAPEILLNRQPSRLAPGSRIRGADNLMQMSGTLTGQRLLVHYTRDSLGQLLDVWVLTPSEAARKPWPSTPEQAANWAFNADTQTWTSK